MAGSSAATPQPHHHHPSDFLSFYGGAVGPTPAVPLHLISNSAAFHLGFYLRRRFVYHKHNIRTLLHSPFKNFPHIGSVLDLEEMWSGKSLHDAWAATCTSCLYFFGGEGSKTSGVEKGKSSLEAQTRGSVSGRQWTNILLAVNVLAYVAQIASQGKLLLLGAKINSLIDRGELWRLVTSSFLHSNIVHLMVNCYSLNSIGPTVENISGPKRFLVVYISSAIASSAMSYWLSQAPAVGASGAIFGLVGSFAMFVMRHNNLVQGGVGDLREVVRMIALNMAIGLLSRGIDNWGHLGGLIGGVAASWLIGPAWKIESLSNSGRRVLVDRAPIFSFSGTKISHQ